MSQNTHPDPAKAMPIEPRQRSWLWRHRTTLFLLSIVLLLVAARWSVFREGWYEATGAHMPEDSIPWRHDYAAALAESAKTGKPVLLDFSATWCPPCQAMRRNVWPDPKVSAAVEAGYIPVALDADNPASVAPGQRYEVDTIPRVLIVDSHGNVLRDGNFMTADQMLQFLASPATQPTAGAF